MHHGFRENGRDQIEPVQFEPPQAPIHRHHDPYRAQLGPLALLPHHQTRQKYIYDRGGAQSHLAEK